MRKFHLALALGLSIAAAPALAQQKPVDLRFGTVGVGGSWYNYGAGIADMVTSSLPAGSSFDVLPKAGGVGNLKLVQAGEMEIAINFSVSAAEACGGFNTFKTKQDKIRSLLGGLDTYYLATFVTKKSGVTSWNDIVAGKNKFHLLTAKAGGTGEVGIRQILEIMGSSKQQVEKNGGLIEATERSGAGETIRDGQADGWAHVVTKGHPAATQIVTVNDMAVLPLPDNVIVDMEKKYGWAPTVIPANTFKGQDQDIKTVKTASNIIVAASVPDDVVYTITKAIMENVDKLKKIHSALEDFDPKLAADPVLNGNCPMHPGAVRYYKEVGLIK